MIKCISFDFDRTLAHMVPPTHHLVPALLAEKGINVTVEDYSTSTIELRNNLPDNLKKRFDLFGSLSKSERVKFIQEYNEMRIDKLKLDSETHDIQSLKKWLLDQMFQRQKKVLYDDVVENILKLKEKKVKLYVLSGNHSDGIIELLEEYKIIQYFEDIITVDKFHPKKADNYKILLEKTNLKPEEILHIGDELETDGYPPKELDMNVLIIKRLQQLDFNKGQFDEFQIITKLSEIFDYFV